MKRRVTAAFLAMTMAAVMLPGCGSKETKGTDSTISASAKKVKLDPDNPVSLKIWHYYNGTQQATFDELLEEFNSSVGKDEGIYVEGYSYGSVSDLEKAVTSSLNEEVGADDLPDIFSTYADTASTVQKENKLADLSKYFSEKERKKYVDSYIQEGYLNQDKKLYLIPVAKSTEVLMINKTDWAPFEEATGTTMDELSTTEGITKAAEKYYKWTDSLTPDVPDDGKALYGRDSMSNYFVIGMKQMGKDIFSEKDGKVVVNTDKDLLKRLWENYYVPYIKGYFAAYGKFRSDDVKTGDILAYTGSTASAFYFPDEVEKEDSSYPIECEIKLSPVMEGGKNYHVQQGAGMAVTKSDEKHEYAASVFLKWFTKKEQNLRFVSESSYLPVLKESNNMKSVDKVIKDNDIKMNGKTYQCLKTVLKNFDNTKFYTMQNVDHGFSMRKVLDYNLSDRAAADKEAMDKEIAAGASREDEIAKYTSDESFESWYKDFCNALKEAQSK